MEVDLELSVGGSFRNLERSKPKIDSDLELCSCSRSEDAKAKREIQARRRQEAKKKREEKKKGMKNGGGGGGGGGGGDEERMRLEARWLQSRVKDREGRENDEAGLTHHKSKIDHRSHGLVEGSIQMMVPIQYAYPPRVQYVPLAFPYVVPCWAPATGIQPLNPLPARQGCGGVSVLSEGSTNSSASVSPQDGGSSDPQSSDSQEKSEHSVSSYQKESSQGASSEKSTSCSEKVSTPVDDRTTIRNSSIGESISKSTPVKKSGERNGDSGEHPNPKARNQSRPPCPPPPPAPNSLERMPCVSTTGNGPNGKTITGLLYRYTETEINIVCVCHGSSFSPAGFVEHAGGVDVSQPLKHITVIPSAFCFCTIN